ncbi:WG repeat-containing protein [Bacteroidota bacterium]
MITRRIETFLSTVGIPFGVILMICFLVSFHASANLPGEYSVIEKDNLKGLINSKGKVLIPPEYEDMGWTTGTHLVVDGIIGYKSDDKWGLISIGNDKITRARYNSIDFLEEDLIIASQPGMTGLTNYYGLINIKGKVIIPFKYISLSGAGNYIIAVTKNENDLLYGLIDKKDNILIPFEYRKIDQIGVDIFSLKDGKERIWLSNKEGDLLIPEFFDEIFQTDENLAIVKRDGKYGLLNTRGDLLLDPVYKKIAVEPDNKVNVLPFTYWNIIDTLNHDIQQFWFDEIEAVNQNIYKASINGTDVFYDKNGSMIGLPGDINIVTYQDDLAIFKEKNKYGILDFNGNIIADPRYDEIEVKESFIFLRANSNWDILGTKHLNLVGSSFSTGRMFSYIELTRPKNPSQSSSINIFPCWRKMLSVTYRVSPSNLLIELPSVLLIRNSSLDRIST